jgi:hypothetical protein
MKVSWKTTVAGIGGILAAVGSAVSAMFDNDPATVANWPLVITAVTVGLGLIFARDADVSSEQQGLK